MAALPTERSWCALEFARSNSVVAVQRAFRRNLDVVVLQRRQSEGGMNNFATEAASVIKGRVAQEDQALPKGPSRECVKVSFGALGNLYLEPVESCRYRSPR
jgi:hypothetical protein